MIKAYENANEIPQIIFNSGINNPVSRRFILIELILKTKLNQIKESSDQISTNIVALNY